MHINHKSLLAFLQQRAHEHAAAGGHILSDWCFAKKKFGKGAIKATCLGCGKTAIVAPHGNALGTVAIVRRQPGISGEAIFTPCAFSKPAEGESQLLLPSA